MALTKLNFGGNQTALVESNLPALTALSMPVGAVLQTITSHSKAHLSSSGHKYNTNDLTILTANITPTSTSHKILIMGFIQVSSTLAATVEHYGCRIFRGTTEIGQGDNGQSSFTSGNAVMHSSTRGDGSTYAGSNCMPFHFVDSPNTTSQITYNIKGYCSKSTSTATLYANRGGYDYNTFEGQTATSNLTLQEIKGV